MSAWLINLGYTLELVPLVVKVAAIQRLLHAARQARRIEVNMPSLYGAVFGISLVVVVFLFLWSVVDAPRRQEGYTLSSDLTPAGETIVWVREYCQSDSDAWRYVAALWHSLLLVAATVLAFQTRKLKTDFNENQSLALMIYSHAVFVLLRVLTFSLEFGDGGESEAMRYRSLIFSCDALTSIGIYFFSKFFLSKDDQNSGVVDLRTSTVATNNNQSMMMMDASMTTGSGSRTGSGHQRKYAVGSGSGHKRNQLLSSMMVPESAVIHSIMEVVEESETNNDGDIAEFGGDDEEDYHASASSSSANNNKKNVDEKLEEQLSQYLSSHSTTGLRCRHCGKMVSGGGNDTHHTGTNHS